MFKEETASPKGIETVIGPTVKVDGNFVGEGNVVVEGTVKGSLKTNQDVKVGEKAKIMANVRAKNAEIAGEVQGNIKIKGTLVLKKSALISGDLEAQKMSVELGALINGKCSMPLPAELKPEEKPEPDKKKK